MKTNSIILVLLLIATICFSQEEGWITDKSSGCKYYTFSNVDKRYIKWNGDCVDGYISGNGTLMVYQSDVLYSTYVGIFKNGKMIGHGSVTWYDGGKYVGEFKEGQSEGQGTITYPNGTKYVGGFKEGNQFGQGICIFPTGDKYEGEWKDGIMNGHGTMFYAQTSNPLYNGRKYIGEWKDGERYGNGVETLGDGSKFITSIVDGKPYMKQYNLDGKLVWEGFDEKTKPTNYSNE